MSKLDQWNDVGRKKNARVCAAFDKIIDKGGSSKEDLTGDDRSEELADAVLAEVVALNKAGQWREARERFDPAHGPFIPHMEKTEQGITAAVILGPDTFLVRRGDWSEDGPTFLLTEKGLEPIAGVVGFAMSRNRKLLAIADAEGISINEGFRGKRARTIAWPEGQVIRPASFGIADDGQTLVVCNDEAGVWLARGDQWTKVMPREGVGDEDEPDVIHAAISPDGKFVAYGWQDAPGHYVDRVEAGGLVRHGVVENVMDTPYHVLFTGDSKRLLANTRYMQGGTTVCVPVESLRDIEEYGDLPDDAAKTDEYLRAYGMVLLPKGIAGKDELAWIGGAGWSHAAPLEGGKPAFTQLFGSTLDVFDFDPASKRAIVGGTAAMLHVVDPTAAADEGRERGYKPRKELYRWILWDTLEAPIRW